MIDLHTHTIFSDGALIPSELVQRAIAHGYRAIAITDHADISNLDFIIPRIIKVAEQLNTLGKIKVIPGIELTHVPPELIKYLVDEARRLGARLIVVHGETIVEPVIHGTNRAAILAGVDILAHPGLIESDDVLLAKEKGTALEITARKGHSLTNGHVAKLALYHGANLVLDTDSHSPEDMITKDTAINILRAAGINKEKIPDILRNSDIIVERVFRK
ncbi:MAG: histidinol phosphate phosphatase domain-containing protein [Nitrospirae bacterium]|nr:histidinol phosphate phosphatase domain-containing protein [Nitrospirota bacterium]